MIPEDLITPAVSAASGGAFVAYVARVALKRWLDGHDELAKAVQGMATAINTLEVKIGFINKMSESQQKYGESIAVLQHEVDNMKTRFERLVSTMKFTHEEKPHHG